MLNKCLNRIEQARTCIKNALTQQNVYSAKQEKHHNSADVIAAIRFFLSSNATDYKNFHDVQNHLSAFVAYISGGERDERAEELLRLQEEALNMTPKYVLYMIQKYLQKIVPANTTYFHFMRQKDFYSQMSAVRFVLVVGLSQLDGHPHILIKLKTQQRLHLFKLVLDWILSLVSYRCSALYIKSSCLDPLIFQAHLLLSGLLGCSQNSVLSTLASADVAEVVNKILYLQAYLLSMAIHQDNQLQISIVVKTLRWLFMSTHPQRINMYLPSYLYARLIGFVKHPYTVAIIYRLLIYFLNKKSKVKHEDNNNSHSSNSSQYLIADSYPFIHQLITECWSVLALLIYQYQMESQPLKALIQGIIKSIEPRSIERAYVMKIINKKVSLTSNNQVFFNEKLQQWSKNNTKPYLVKHNIVKTELLTQNYHKVIQGFHLKSICEASKKRLFSVPTSQIWQLSSRFNKYNIMTLQDYQNQLKIQDNL